MVGTRGVSDLQCTTGRVALLRSLWAHGREVSEVAWLWPSGKFVKIVGKLYKGEHCIGDQCEGTMTVQTMEASGCDGSTLRGFAMYETVRCEGLALPDGELCAVHQQEEDDSEADG